MLKVNGVVIPTNKPYKVIINGKWVSLTVVKANNIVVWKYIKPATTPPVGGGGHWKVAGSFHSPSDKSNGTTIRCQVTPHQGGGYTCFNYVWVPADETDQIDIDDIITKDSIEDTDK